MDSPEPVSIYYLSSGRLGVPVMDALVADARIHLLGVGSQPDRPSGRKRRLEPTVVTEHALSRGLVPERVPDVNSPAWLSRLARLSPDLVVVAAFGQILKGELLELPAHGCFNIHASLLPRHRGASPVTAAILAGDSCTGISFMRMDRGLDTGPVYDRVSTNIQPGETAEALEQRLGALAARHVVDIVRRVVREGLTATAQVAEEATYAPRLRKEDGEIDWRGSAACLERRVRALLPWPRAFTWMPAGGTVRRLQVTVARVGKQRTSNSAPGMIVQADVEGLVVACGEGCLRLLEVVPEGRSRMPAPAFLRGNTIAVGTRLGAPGSGK